MSQLKELLQQFKKFSQEDKAEFKDQVRALGGEYSQSKRNEIFVTFVTNKQ